MSRPRAADDAETISRRIAELRAERTEWARCTCDEVVDSCGNRARSVSACCPVHSDFGQALAANGLRIETPADPCPAVSWGSAADRPVTMISHAPSMPDGSAAGLCNRTAGSAR